MRRLSLGMLVVVGLAVASECLSQQTASADPRVAVLEPLRATQVVRIHAQDVGIVQGRFLSASRDSLFLATSVGDRALPIVALDSLWVRGTAAKTGAMVGAVPGVIAGTAFGIAFNAGLCASLEAGNDPCPVAIPFFGVIIGGVGAGMGALLGAAVPKWHRKFPQGRRPVTVAAP